jgi:hypothetical protein
MKFLAFAGSIVIAAVVGCSSAPPRSAAVQASGVSVAANDFERLMKVTDDVSRDLLFAPAVQDYRSGLYRTEPALSAQWFEFWRSDVRTASDAAESSLAKIRRTLTVRIEKDESGRFIAKPEVLVERYSLAERRLTTAAGYRSIFRERHRPTGNSLTDAGIAAPDAYWYSVGNDPELERYVARRIEDGMKKS